MRNIAAIAHKEIRSYFASPIAYVVVGLFALLFGWFYAWGVAYFVRQSMQMQMQGMTGGGLNVNQMLIRPLLLNASVYVLFVLPMVTMRTYSEEKRSGTIELLLTSPITDLEIIAGKFLGALALYGCMLLVTAVYVGLLFRFGNPEWGQVATGYLGLVLMGGCFIALGLFISSLTRNQIVAAMITFAVFLFLWVIDWAASFTGPTMSKVLSYLSIMGHYEDFAKGVIDTSHLVYYLSFITFGLFLTAKAVDSERWRG